MVLRVARLAEKRIAQVSLAKIQYRRELRNALSTLPILRAISTPMIIVSRVPRTLNIEHAPTERPATPPTRRAPIALRPSPARGFRRLRLRRAADVP